MEWIILDQHYRGSSDKYGGVLSAIFIFLKKDCDYILIIFSFCRPDRQERGSAGGKATVMNQQKTVVSGSRSPGGVLSLKKLMGFYIPIWYSKSK